MFFSVRSGLAAVSCADCRDKQPYVPAEVSIQRTRCADRLQRALGLRSAGKCRGLSLCSMGWRTDQSRLAAARSWISGRLERCSTCPDILRRNLRGGSEPSKGHLGCAQRGSVSREHRFNLELTGESYSRTLQRAVPRADRYTGRKQLHSQKWSPPKSWKNSSGKAQSGWASHRLL